MNKEHVKGAADAIVGETKGLVGRATGNKKLETEGKVDRVKGTAHNTVGDVKDAGQEAIESVRNAPSRH